MVNNAQKNNSMKWILKINQPNRRGGVSSATSHPTSQLTQAPKREWRPKTSPQAVAMSSTELIMATIQQTIKAPQDRYDFSTLERMSAQALTANAHGSHCSMTHIPCTTSFPIAFKHSEVVRVNQDLAQTLVFPPKHAKSDSTSNCFPKDNKQEVGSNWWSTMRKTIHNTSLQVFAKD